MANQLVQYGAVAAGAAAIPAVAKGVSAAASTFSFENAWSSATGTGSIAGSAGAAAADGATAFSSQISSTFTDPSFLTSAGIGLAAALLGSGSKRPSLSLPNIAATAAVALSVGSLLKQGRAAAESSAASKGGGTIVNPVKFVTSDASDIGQQVATRRGAEEQAFYRFPLNSNQMYWMRFSIRPYERSASGNPYTMGSFHTTITLPLPNTINDAIKLAYQDIGLGMFGGEVLNDIKQSLDSYSGTSGTVATKTGAATKSLYGSMSAHLTDPNFMYAIGRRLLTGTNQAFGAGADIITGTAPNPHMAVTFQGVNLKKHSFTWRLSPDNYEESVELESIIRNLQAAALPGFESADSKLFLRFPDITQVEMSPSNIMTFQPCAIDSVLVNYAPNGVPSFFAPPSGIPSGSVSYERYPTEVELTIVLRELDIHTNDMAMYKTARAGQTSARNAPSTDNAPKVEPIAGGN